MGFSVSLSGKILVVIDRYPEASASDLVIRFMWLLMERPMTGRSGLGVLEWNVVVVVVRIIDNWRDRLAWGWSFDLRAFIEDERLDLVAVVVFASNWRDL